MEIFLLYLPAVFSKFENVLELKSRNGIIAYLED